MDRPENILFRTKDPSSDIVIADFGMWVPLVYHETDLSLTHIYSAKHLESSKEPLMTLEGSYGYLAPEALNHKGHGKPVDLWAIGYLLLPNLE